MEGEAAGPRSGGGAESGVGDLGANDANYFAQALRGERERIADTESLEELRRGTGADAFDDGLEREMLNLGGGAVVIEHDRGGGGDLFERGSFGRPGGLCQPEQDKIGGELGHHGAEYFIFERAERKLVPGSGRPHACNTP